MDDLSKITPERIKHPSQETDDYLRTQAVGYRFTVPGLIAAMGNGLDKSDYASISGFATKATENGMLAKIAKQWVEGYRRRLCVYELVDKTVKRPGTRRRTPSKIVRGHLHLPEIPKEPKPQPLATWDDPAPEPPLEKMAAPAPDQFEQAIPPQRPIDRAIELANELRDVLDTIREHTTPAPTGVLLSEATKDELMAELNRRWK